ncbi:MAG: TauD/TfdA family dioxygenase [Deltaproteobacteria bacterium]
MTAQLASHMSDPVAASFANEQRLPLVYQPSSADAAQPGFLQEWIPANMDRLAEDLRIYGASLFRGFCIPDASTFEQIALALDARLAKQYPGIAVRSRIAEHVFTSTEFPNYYPLPQHAEMAYTPTPPRKVFFFCQVAPGEGGETPLSDLRKVWNDLPGPLRERVEHTGIKYIRVHGASFEKRAFRLWGGRRWSDVYDTQDPAEAERAARAQGYAVTWLSDGSMKLENTLPGYRVHPQHGTVAWHNQAHAYVPAGLLLEYEHIAAYQQTLRSKVVNLGLKMADALRRYLVAQERYDHNATYGDGAPIGGSDLKEIVDTTWRHLACFRWMPSDLLVVDNFSVSHGRLPFRGKRQILVALTDGYPILS